MIVRIKVRVPAGGGTVQLVAAACDDQGREVFELPGDDLRVGDTLDLGLPGVDVTRLISASFGLSSSGG